MEQTVNQAIMECKAGKNREGNLNWIIQKFQPVICKYAGKLYSLEYEDAVQELNEALIMAVVSIDVCNAGAGATTGRVETFRREYAKVSPRL